MTFVQVVDAQGEVLVSHVKWCDTFFSRLRGLMFRRALANDEGLILVERRSSIASTSIHMFFVNFDIATFWLDDDQKVIHKTLARRWRPYYASPRPARFVLETSPALLNRIAIGDVLNFEKEVRG